MCVVKFGGGTSIELTFSNGTKVKVNGKLVTGNQVLNSNTMIPLVMAGVSTSVDYCRAIQAFISTSTKNYTTLSMDWGAVASGGRGYSVPNIYLPSILPSLEELKKVKSYNVKVSRDGDWGRQRSTTNCLMWIEF